MSNLVILIFIYTINLYSQNQYIEMNNYYSVQNYNLKILEFDVNNILFYGTNGGILKTTDGGENWIQNYSGTKSDIVKIIKHDKVLYGITDDGYLMTSTDNGDFWSFEKIDESLIDLIFYNDNILMFSNSNYLFQKDLKLKEISILSDTPEKLLNAFKINNNIFALNAFKKLYKFDFNLKGWKNINIPFEFNWNINYNNNYLYLYNQNNILLYDGNNWRIDTINNLSNIYSYHILNYVYLDNNKYIIFNNLNSAKAPKININSYNFETKNDFAIDSILLDKSKIGLSFYDRKINDIKQIGAYYYITMRSKTILRTSDFKLYETLYLLPYNTFDKQNLFKNVYFNKNNFIINESSISGNTITKGHNYLLKSNNQGKSFLTLPIVDSINIDNNDSYYPYFGKIFCRDSLDFLIECHGGVNHDYKSEFFTSSIKYYRTLDGGQSFKALNELNNINSFRLAYNINDFDLIGFHKDKYYFFKYEILQSSMLKNNNGVSLDSIRNHLIYTIDNNNSLDSIPHIADSLNTFDYYIDDSFIWFFGYRTTSYFEIIDSVTNLEMKKYRTTGAVTYRYSFNDNTWVKINEEHPGTIYKSKNGKYYQLKSNKIYETDQNLKNSKIIDFDFDKISLYKDENSSTGLIEDKLFLIDRYSSKDTTEELIFIDFNSPNYYNKLNIEYYEDILLTRDRKSVFYIQDKKLFIPIEKDRLAYYTSVEELTPPSIWTYPPYPNPVKDRLKMKFYSAIMGQIANLKIELIEIGSGRVYNINDYKLSKTDDYFGEIDINISNYNSGAYLINFKLGESNKSESIIIE